MKNNLVITSLISILLIYGCTDHIHDNTDRKPPVITIETPFDNQIIKSVGTVNINGMVEDEGLHELTISVINENSGKVLFFEQPIVHDSMHYTINKSFNIVATSDIINAILQVMAEDHNANKSTRNINFKIIQ